MGQVKPVRDVQILGIGHAMCDVSSELEIRAWDELRKEFPRMVPGAPAHVDAEQACNILSYLEEKAAKGQGRVSYAAGGSALNAVRVASFLGTKTSFAGCIGDDTLGGVVRAGLAHANVKTHFGTVGEHGSTGLFCTVSPQPREAAGGESVSRRLVFASPSAARFVRDIDFDGFDLRGINLIHVEGLLADRSQNLERLLRRASMMKKKVSIDVVSSEAAKRNRDTLNRLIQDYADFVFCNRDEYEALNIDLADCRADIVWLIKTDRAGVDCFASGQRIHIDAPKCPVVDDLGAGDAFAGAFLSGMLAGLPAERCLQLGTAAAACALQSRGPEPDERCLRALSRGILAE